MFYFFVLSHQFHHAAGIFAAKMQEISALGQGCGQLPFADLAAFG